MERTILSLAEQDDIIRYMAHRIPVGTLAVSETQATKIKAVWRLLHEYDSEHEYTFNESYTKIRKEKK